LCGIVGFLDKTKNEQAPVGQTIFKMLEALGRRGPDSAGVAILTATMTAILCCESN
jgi:asparagine synthetase B (glutamine-hydrolysing)